MWLITHSDADGIISAYLAMKIFGNGKIMFSSPSTLSKTLSSIKNKKDKLVILDMAPNKETLEQIKKFQEIVWIDHHVNKLDVPQRIKFISKQLPSTAEVISQEFKIQDEKLVRIANEIDTNKVKTKDAEKLRDYINYIRDTAKGSIFIPSAKELVTKLDNLDKFLSHPQMMLKIMAYKVKNQVKLDSIQPQWVDIRDMKVAFVELKHNMPVHEVYKKVKADYLIVLSRKKQGIKVEFRTHTNKNVMQLAELIGGGGHLHAAGAFTDNKNLSNIKKKILNFIKKKL